LPWQRDPCTDLVHSVIHQTAKGTEMRHHRILILLFAAVLVSATVLAFTSAARAEDAIVKLVSAENGKCLQPINGSLNQGDAIIQQPCNGSVAQQWTVKSVSSTKVHLVNRASHFCLDARGKAVNGTPIQRVFSIGPGCSGARARLASRTFGQITRESVDTSMCQSRRRHRH
jgi:hypothetical protein